MGEKFDMSAVDAEKKFISVRIGYGRYLKNVKQIPSGFGRDAVPVLKDFAGLDLASKIYRPQTTVSDYVGEPKKCSKIVIRSKHVIKC